MTIAKKMTFALVLVAIVLLCSMAGYREGYTDGFMDAPETRVINGEYIEDHTIETWDGNIWSVDTDREHGTKVVVVFETQQTNDVTDDVIAEVYSLG